MLREDRKAGFIEAGAFGRRRRFAAGDVSAPLSLSKRRLRQLIERSNEQPQRLLEGEPDRWWLWRGKVYIEDEGYDEQDMLALLAERERRKQRRLDRAKAQLDREGGPDALRSGIPRDVKLAVWQRDRGRCVSCGSQQLLEFDHVIPLAMGGSDNERNLQILCADCNRAKANGL
jgi:5-methylcytosine-specific restriction endonuclease McrA